MDFKDHWDLETALRVVRNKTVDSELWAEAVEWLLLYGPKDIVAILLQASGQAFEGIGELQVAEHSHEGKPCRNIEELAASMGVSEEDVRHLLAESEPPEHLLPLIVTPASKTVH